MLTNLPIHSNEPLVNAAYAICRWHHERYDGRGYPDGLMGDDIPISAQAVAIADVYDALTSKRCYKDAYSHETALQMILEGQCGAFNPLLLECLMELKGHLPKELGSLTANHRQEDSAALRSELSKQESLSVSAIGFKRMQIEQEKYRFLVDVLPEGVFSYNRDSDIFTLSPKAARDLGLSEVLSAPRENAAFRNIFSDEFLEIGMQKADSSTRQAPNFTITGTLSNESGSYPITFRCRSIWIDDEDTCCGFMGLIPED